MRKKFLIVLLILSLLLVSCKSNSKNTVDREGGTIEEDERKEIETNKDDIDKKSDSLFAEGILKNKEFSNILAEIDYIDDDTYNLKIRIEQKDDITFTTDNQNVYIDIYISSENLDNSEILYQKNIEDKSLFKIPLSNNKIPEVTEILIDKDSILLTEEEHKAILEKDKGLWISVQLRDPQGFILEIANTIFQDQI